MHHNGLHNQWSHRVWILFMKFPRASVHVAEGVETPRSNGKSAFADSNAIESAKADFPSQNGNSLPGRGQEVIHHNGLHNQWSHPVTPEKQEVA
jgi:hypothetical protein